MSSSTPSEPLASRDSEYKRQMKKTILALCEDNVDSRYALRRAISLLDLHQVEYLFEEVAAWVEDKRPGTPRPLLNERFGDPKSDTL